MPIGHTPATARARAGDVCRVRDTFRIHALAGGEATPFSCPMVLPLFGLFEWTQCPSSPSSFSSSSACCPSYIGTRSLNRLLVFPHRHHHQLSSQRIAGANNNKRLVKRLFILSGSTIQSLVKSFREAPQPPLERLPCLPNSSLEPVNFQLLGIPPLSSRESCAK